uniref:Uncharacterized protein n=1 Tax=Setaria italica TaxID=4555 RepID=K3ZEL2_SETIT
SEFFSIQNTNPSGFSLPIKYTYEGLLLVEADLWDIPVNTWPMLLSLTNMYCIEWLKLHYASKMWNMTCEKTVTTFLRWAFEINCTQLQEKCMSLIALISLNRILTEDFVFVCYHHPEVIKRIHVLALRNVE